MTEEIKALFEERLGRYQAAIALEPTDRIPIGPGSNYFAEVFSGNNHQETLYDPEKWLEAEMAFIREFPETDVLRDNRLWAPSLDAVGLQTYRLPGRDLPPDGEFQFVEREYMKADEYDLLIESPMDFLFSRWLPRILGEYGGGTELRSYVAFLKGGLAQAQYAQIFGTRAARLKDDCGMPQPMTGTFLAPFDVLADSMRGLTGVITDTFRQPDKVLAACDRLVEEMANLALNTADPLKRYPIFVPTHKACFLSPEQFEIFYWPSFKRVLEILTSAGYKVRAYLEGDWSPHWHHMLELPKGTIICDIDNQASIFQAKRDIGHHQCLAGGIPDSQLILGTPEDIRQTVRNLCETVGADGGFVIGGGCNIPYDTKPENYRAMTDAVLEFGHYDESVRPLPKDTAGPVHVEAFDFPKKLTPWEIKKNELGGSVLGDEELIRKPWDKLEAMAYTWLWQWI